MLFLVDHGEDTLHQAIAVSFSQLGIKTIRRGVGLIWRDMKAFGPIYAGKLTAEGVAARIEGYWRPYHAALAAAVDGVHAAFGRVVHVNCHSMASMGDRTTEDGEVPRPDFVVSDRDGTTCAPAVIDCAVETLRAAGYSVSVNHPYKGFEIVRRHAPDIGEGAVSTRESRNGNYLAVTVRVMAESREQMDRIYQDLVDHEHVTMAL